MTSRLFGLRAVVVVTVWLVLELEGNDVFEFLRLLRNASAASARLGKCPSITRTGFGCLVLLSRHLHRFNQ